jgi:Tol biopolymer transport system component
MSSKQAIILCVALSAMNLHVISADDAKPSGRRVLISVSDALYVTDPAGLDRRKIADNVGAAALSNDGNFVAYEKDVGGNAVFVLSLPDGQTVKLADIHEGRIGHLIWSPDGRLLAYDLQVPMKSWDLFVVAYPPNGEPPRNLGHWYETLDFSPDGKFLVHPSRDPLHHNILETVNVDTAKHETVYKAASTLWQAKYAPDGRSIAFTMAKLTPRQAADDDEPECGGPQIDLWLLPRGSQKPVEIMDRVYTFDWSPDARWLAIETGTDECDYPPDDAAIFISSADGKQQFQLSKTAPSIGPRFSPDSKQVIFVDYNEGHLVVGDIQTRQLTVLPGDGRRQGFFTLSVCDWK